MQAHIVALTQDRQAVLTAADMTTFINEAGNWYYTTYADRVRHDTAATTGLTIAGATFSGTTTPAVYAKLLGATREAANNTTDGTELERVTPEELFALRRAFGASGTPTRWAAWRNAAVTAAGVESPRPGTTRGQWTVLLHPTPSVQTFVSLEVELLWTDFVSTGADDAKVADLLPEQAYTVARLASIPCWALLLRRPPAFTAGA